MLKNLLSDPEFFMNVLETMNEGLMIMDCDGQIKFFNRAAERITGYKREEVLGQPCTILDSDTCVILTESGKQKCCDLFKKGSIHNKRCRIRAKAGDPVYLMKNAVVLKNDRNEVIGGVESITNITSLYKKELELEELKQELRQHYWFMGLLGNSESMHKLFDKIRNAATSEAPVLICGESGTGKELVANAIHQLSRRKGKPFIKMNCAALNEYLMESELFGHKKGSFTGAISDREGRFVAADTGTIFLDEIGDMPQMMQVKLLRVLEEKIVERVGEHKPISVDIRLISATHQDLHELVAEGRFRHDLLYRINPIIVHTPPLREKREDIPLLVGHYLKKIAITNDTGTKRMSGAAMDVLTKYHWPGNVRHLINALEHAAITSRGDAIEVSDLPDYVFHEQAPAKNEIQHSEKEDIRGALALHNGNRTKAAAYLGISRVTLWKKIKELRLDF
jgi:two-component system response regulator HydG